MALVAGQEIQGEDGVQEPLVQGDLDGPVGVLQAPHILEARLPQVEFKTAALSAGRLVGQDELGVDGVRLPRRKGRTGV